MSLDIVANIEAIGFDLDGTLYQSETIPKSVIEEMIYTEVARKLTVDRQLAEFLFKQELNKQKSQSKTLAMLDINPEIFYGRLWDTLPLGQYLHRDEKLISVFSKLQCKRLFILSNSNRIDQIKNKIELLGLSADIFEDLVSTNGMGAVKPDAKPFIECLDRLRLAAEQVLYVGDRVRVDILGAKQVGMKTCLVGSESSEPDMCIRTIYELENYV